MFTVILITSAYLARPARSFTTCTFHAASVFYNNFNNCIGVWQASLGRLLVRVLRQLRHPARLVAEGEHEAAARGIDLEGGALFDV